jgi:NlpC/P60 family
MITTEQIAVSARKLIGAPWHHQGRSIETGIDCIGGVIFVCLDTGYSTPELINQFDIQDYSRRPDTYELLVNILQINFDEVSTSDIQEGDIVTLRMEGDRLTSHVGIVVKGVREYDLIHSLQNKVTIEEPLARWNKFITHVFRFKSL